MALEEEDVMELMETFKKAEKSQILNKKIKAFLDAVNLSEDVIEEYPNLEEKIRKIRKANIRSILLFLSTERPDVGPEEFIELILRGYPLDSGYPNI